MAKVSKGDGYRADRTSDYNNNIFSMADMLIDQNETDSTGKGDWSVTCSDSEEDREYKQALELSGS